MARGRGEAFTGARSTAVVAVVSLVASVAAILIGAARAEATALLPTYAIEPVQSDLAAYSIAPSREGYVWMGAPASVARWDGQRFQTLEANVPGATSPGHRLAIADDGTVWIARNLELHPPGRGPRQQPRPGWPRVRLMWSHDGRWNHFRHSGEVLAGPLDALAADPGGAWLGTRNGLFRFAAGQLSQPPDLPTEVAHGSVLALLTIGDELLVGTSSALAHRRGKLWTVRPIEGGVQAIASVGGGGFALGTRAGLALLDGDRLRRLSAADGLPADDVRAVQTADDGSIWLGTARGIAIVAADGTAVDGTIGMADGLPDDDVLALGRDRDGTIWVGTATGGVVTMARRTLWNLGRRDGLPTDATSAVLRAGDGRIWIATSEGLAVADGDKIRTLRRGQELPADAEPRALAEAPDGSLRVSTRGAGVLRVDPQRLTVSRVAVPWRNAGALTFDAAGDLWVGSASEGQIARLGPDGRLSSWTSSDGVCDAPVTSAATLADGTAWFGSADAGLTRIDASGARCFTQADGLPRDAIGALLTDGNQLWVGLRFDGGVARFVNGRFAAIDSSRGLPCDSVHALVRDGEGNLWTGCGLGIAQLPFGKLEQAILQGGRAVAGVAVNVSDGMRAQSCSVGAQPGAALAPDGSVWFATPLGVTIVRLASAPAPPTPVPVIESLTLDGRERDLDGVIEATGTAVSFSAVLAAPASRAFRRVRIEHRLVGIDGEWVGSGEERAARYRQLPPGRYRLQVRATRDGQRWAQAAPIDVAVLAPFHRRPEVIVALALGIAGLVFAAHRSRVRTLARAHAVVQRERERIARELHDGLGQSLSAAGYLLKAAEQKLDGEVDVAGVRTIVANTRAVLARSYDEARRSTWYLRDPEAAGRPLEHALREIVDAARSGAGGPDIQLVVEGQPEVDAPDVRRELPAIAHEAITNAIRHADARRIDVKLVRGAEGVSLVVRDDGRGIGYGVDLAMLRRQGHFGLLGIEERTARVGGVVSVAPADGGGTEIRVTIGRERSNSIVHANGRQV